MEKRDEHTRADHESEDGQPQRPSHDPSRSWGVCVVWPPCRIAWSEFDHDSMLYRQPIYRQP